MNRSSICSLFVIAAALSVSTGCATTALHAEVDALSAENARQAQEVRELQARAAALSAKQVGGDLAIDGIDMAKSAWAYVSNVVGASYKATSEKAHECYQAIDFKSVKTEEDAKAAAMACWATGN
jgi:hypothetical protein